MRHLIAALLLPALFACYPNNIPDPDFVTGEDIAAPVPEFGAPTEDVLVAAEQVGFDPALHPEVTIGDYNFVAGHFSGTVDGREYSAFAYAADGRNYGASAGMDSPAVDFYFEDSGRAHMNRLRFRGDPRDLLLDYSTMCEGPSEGRWDYDYTSYVADVRGAETESGFLVEFSVDVGATGDVASGWFLLTD